MPKHTFDAAALRARINTYSPYVGAGIEVTHIAEDGSEIRVEMALTDQNRSIADVHFGGSLYAMVDPHTMLLLMHRLGPDYVVWDKAASIEYVKPGRGTVRAVVRVTEAEVDAIRSATANGERHLPQWSLEVVDEEGEVVASVLKTLHVRKKRVGDR